MGENRPVMSRIAIAGPDGAGKSSICAFLSNNIPGAVVQYAGKNRNHLLRTTSLGLNLWMKLRRFGAIPGLLGQYFLFYPLEYIENRVRFSINKQVESGLIIYDRHPIDRMMMQYSLILRRGSGRLNPLRFAVEYPLCWLVARLYQFLFPEIDRIYVLLPHPELCFKRSGGQYSEIEDAIIRVESYRQVVLKAGPDSRLLEIPVDWKHSIHDIGNEILYDMKAMGLAIEH